jgi:hypothetical protein
MTTATTEAAKPKRRKRNSMQEAKASWNTIYLDKSGFECQLTLRDQDFPAGEMESLFSSLTRSFTKKRGPAERRASYSARINKARVGTRRLRTGSTASLTPSRV